MSNFKKLSAYTDVPCEWVSAAVPRNDKLDQLKAENDKLVNVLHEVEEDAIYAYHCLQSDIEHVMEGQTHFFEKWWHAECERERLETENATLGRGTCKPTTYDNGYLTDHLEPGEYYEFWEPACACSECGELIPMRRFCPNCGARIEVDE